MYCWSEHDFYVSKWLKKWFFVAWTLDEVEISVPINKSWIGIQPHPIVCILSYGYMCTTEAELVRDLLVPKPNVLFIWSIKEKVCQLLPCVVWSLTSTRSPHCPSLLTHPASAFQPQWSPCCVSIWPGTLFFPCQEYSFLRSLHGSCPFPIKVYSGISFSMKANHNPTLLCVVSARICAVACFLPHSTSHFLTYCLDYLFLHLLCFGCFPHSGLRRVGIFVRFVHWSNLST